MLRSFFFVFLVGVLGIKASEAASTVKYVDEIPNHFADIGGDEYYISPDDTKVSALNATQTCNAMNMTLVNLETQAKFELISDYLHYNDLGNIYYWTAGRELLTRWMWTGVGQPITYFKWIAGQPDRADIYSCLLVKGSLGLDDTDCAAATFAYICEYPKC